MKRNNILKSLLGICVLAFGFAVFDASADIQHKVKKGETIYGIAYKYNISPDALLKANPQANEGVVKDMILIIPDGKGPIVQETPSVPTDPSSNDAKEADLNEELPTVVEEVEPIEQPKEIEQPVKTQPIAKPQPQETSSTNKDIYVVKNGDDFYSISKKTGVSVDRLIQLNPFDDPTRLVVGQQLRLSENAEPAISILSSIEEDSKQDDIFETPVLPLDTVITIQDNFVVPQAEEQRGSIMIMLPFASESDKASKQSKSYVDFYRGFMMAANELCMSFPDSLRIIVEDLSNPKETLEQRLEKAVEKNVSLIVTPEDTTMFHMIVDFAQDNGIYTLNMFNFRDEAYKNHSHVIQGNITQDLMYEKAVEYLDMYYDDFTPVFLHHEKGKQEKASFVQLVRDNYVRNGIYPIDITYSESLEVDDLAQLLDGKKYIFIPESGALSTFNSFIPQYLEYRNASTNPERIALFGYPDWTGFRGKALDYLHKSEAMVYSRFNYNYDDALSHNFGKDFHNWYGTKQVEAVPSPSILGYDTGKMLINAFQSNGISSFLNHFGSYEGIQSSFSFMHSNVDSGYVNNSLYIISFGPESLYSVRAL